jgi:DNA-binding transcriptional ArsR family regulator
MFVNGWVSGVQDVEVIEDPAVAVAALDPVRARLLAELREPASAAALAARVGLSRQKVNYHLRQLEERGLVEAAGTRTWGGLTERLLVATAAGYVVSPEVLGAATRLVARYHDEQAPQGRWQRLTVAIHPVPKGVDPGAPRDREPPAPDSAPPTEGSDDRA